MSLVCHPRAGFERVEDSDKMSVTTGAGFVGSNLCETLANLGQDVTIPDNPSSGTGDKIRRVGLG